MSVTNKTIRELETAAVEAVQAMNELAELLDGGGGSAFLRDQRIGNRLERMRIAAIELDRAETACSRERCLTMSEAEMREEFEALGLDWDETTERGQALLQRLLAEYDAKREAEIVRLDDGERKFLNLDELERLPAGSVVHSDKRSFKRSTTGFWLPQEMTGSVWRTHQVQALGVILHSAEINAGPDPVVARAEPPHFDPRAVAKGMFPTHIGPSGAHYGDGTFLEADPQLRDLPVGHQPGGLGDGGKSPTESYFSDIERLKQIAEARALLKARGWVEEVSGDWSPAPALGWAIDINRQECSPAILRALAILAEEAQS